jgi:ADP-heptose:LPS heptosyltransferase
MLKRFKQERPNSFLSVLCVKEFSQFFAKAPFIDRLILVPAADIEQIVSRQRLDDLRQYPGLLEEYDAVINLTHSRTGGLFSEAARAARKAGLVCPRNSEGQVKSDWAKYLFASQRNRLQNLFNLVDMHTGMAGLSHAPIHDYMAVMGDEQKRADAILRANGFQGKGSLIAFQMGANQLHRAWPTADFASLATRLLARSDVEIAILGSGRETELRRRFLLEVSAPVIDLVGKTDMSDLPGLLERCSLVVSNDTGTIHIAAAVGTRVIGLYFSTAYFAETAPYGKGHTIVQAETPCSPCQPGENCEAAECRDFITVDLVHRLAERALDGSSGWIPDCRGVSIHESMFLSNGTLMYAPASSSCISRYYLIALMHRHVWESVLGVAHDRTFLEECIAKAGPSGRLLRARAEELRTELAGFKHLYAQALQLTRQATRELVISPLSREDLGRINQNLKRIDAGVASSGESLMKYFHMLAMTDMDYSGFPGLVRQLARTYARLHEIAETSLEAVGSFLPYLPEV